MQINIDAYNEILKELSHHNAQLIAVSKTKPIAALQELYNSGQRDFGENYVQELVDKHTELPADIRWHFIGHLQSNKVKYIAPFVYLIQGVDSLKLLKEINKQGEKLNKKVNLLLQVHIAQEETKFGFDRNELEHILQHNILSGFNNITIHGFMGMASFTDDQEKIRSEFRNLKVLFNQYASMDIPNCKMEILSMGMSGDYKIALQEGSTMVRIGSLIFGSRS